MKCLFESEFDATSNFFADFRFKLFSIETISVLRKKIGARPSDRLSYVLTFNWIFKTWKGVSIFFQQFSPEPVRFVSNPACKRAKVYFTSETVFDESTVA